MMFAIRRSGKSSFDLGGRLVLVIRMYLPRFIDDVKKGKDRTVHLDSWTGAGQR
jgi:hypothetical protein